MAQPDAVAARTRKAMESLRSLVDRFPRTQQAAAEMDFIELAEADEKWEDDDGFDGADDFEDCFI